VEKELPFVDRIVHENQYPNVVVISRDIYADNWTHLGSGGALTVIQLGMFCSTRVFVS
jgi:hypothetical protein